jgi:hypothetical protein
MQIESLKKRFIVNKLRLRLIIIDKAVSAVVSIITEIVAETVTKTIYKYAKLFM